MMMKSEFEDVVDLLKVNNENGVLGFWGGFYGAGGLCMVN